MLGGTEHAFHDPRSMCITRQTPITAQVFDDRDKIFLCPELVGAPCSPGAFWCLKPLAVCEKHLLDGCQPSLRER